MTFDEFNAAQPSNLSGALLALWWESRGDWERAHQVAQDLNGPDAAWVHAYLHRKEGDEANAAYWYRRAGQPIFRGPFDAESQNIIRRLLEGRR